ncbi:Protein Z-Dependent Protease Inhibitor [Manis pentadactyla]|nr:Protein Z-Dependent Protease Inhibitor [Manis pentadactyla]
MTDVEADVVGAGYGVDVNTVRFRILRSWEGERQIDLHHHGVASVTSMLTLRVEVKGPWLALRFFVKKSLLKIWLRRELGCNSDVRFPETLALLKELGFGSDVTGSARWWIRFMGECALQFQDYSEALVVSMVIFEFQATGSRLSFMFTVRHDRH